MEIKLVSVDIDNTIYSDENCSDIFYKVWENLPEGKRPLLVYNTGRMPDNVLEMIKNGQVPEADYLISGVGTKIYVVREHKILKEFSQILVEGWNKERVEEIITELPYNIEKQPSQNQNAYKSSWYFKNATDDEIKRIEEIFNDSELEVNIIYSSSFHLDIVPKWANKGNALKWLLKNLGIDSSSCLVSGDSGNDLAMFQIEGVKGIVVGNSQPELYKGTKYLDVYHSDKKCAEGVIEGFIHYGIIDKVPEHLEKKTKRKVIENLFIKESKKATEELSGEQLDYLKLAYKKAREAINRNITDMGFSACSLDDNKSSGTDINYRSIWTRDSSIVIIGLLPLIDEELIRNTVKATFNTLLKNISPSGQLPSNVSIDTKEPDYSGIGGICSIDSGIWLVIAFYRYVSKTRDIDFLREHFDCLQRIMDWLSAHDGNNDALLEIPEAGDWTDLFGRSYNVLYDEVLWYMANIAFGRLLEILGLPEKAGDYLRWSQIIKKEILINFWPTTKNRTEEGLSFAEQQYSLGDVRYLIAQVTPFNYNWRCDIFGNVMAYLFDVTDNEKAQSTFKFLWGIGASDPYPVKNIYPVVQSGDPDWHPYYTVNLLNLPNQYHNGGVWLFVGGFWVRFINKLGYKVIAAKELYKLAKASELGVNDEWEFNEWIHGTTGRPMGKAFQAWSASEFIHAYHDLNLNSK